MKHIIAIISVLFTAATFAASPAATQEWVRNYVATNSTAGGVTADWVRTYVSTNNPNVVITQTVNPTNGIATTYYDDPIYGRLTGTMHMCDQLALVVTNCSEAAIAMGVTNGTLFAWNDTNAFENAQLNLFISTVSTNAFSFNGVQSVTNDWCDVVDGYFWIMGTRIDRPTRESLLFDDQSASISILDLITPLVIPSAYAASWGDAEEWTYIPKFEKGTERYMFLTVAASNMKTTSILYENGEMDKNSFDKAAKFLSENRGLSTEALFYDMIRMFEDVAEINLKLAAMDKDLEELDEKLDKAFAEVFKQLKEIRVENETTGKSKVYTTKQRSNKYVVFSAPPDSDYKSIDDYGGNYLYQRAYQIKGWADKDNYATSLSDLMTSDVHINDRANHQLVARKNKGGELHYIPLGDVMSSIAVLPTQGGVAYKGKKIKFKSAEDSNVKFTISNDPDDPTTVLVEIGVYWK